jgi:hypothetical protein
MRLRLQAGLTVHPAPFGGAFVVDRARLAAVEIGDELVALLAGEGVVGPEGLAQPLRAEVEHGLAQGWLSAQQEDGLR